MTRATLTCLAAAALFGAITPPARSQPPAGVTFSYDLFVGTSTTPASGSISYTPGQDLVVKVFLTQTGGSATYLSDEGGLFQGGVRLTYGSSVGTAGVLSVTNASTRILLNTTTATPPGTSAFNDVSGSNATRQLDAGGGGDYAQFTPFTDANYGVLPDGNGRILLGTVTFSTSGAGGTTNLVLDDIPPDSVADNLTLGGTVLDSAISPASFSITPVPEPTYLLGLAAAGLLAARWRLVR